MVQQCGLDESGQKAFIIFHTQLGEKPKSTVRFFDRNEYYTVHGDDDAEFAAKSIFKSTSVIKRMSIADGCRELSYVILSKNNFEDWLRELLLVMHYRVEVYVVPKGKGGGHSAESEWHLEFRGSPGNLVQFEDMLFTNRDMVTNSSLISICMKIEKQQKTIGIACLDTNFLFNVLEFADDDFYTELEAIVVILSPQECLLPSFDGDYAKIKTVVERNGILATHRKSSEFQTAKNELSEQLKQLLHFEKGQQDNIYTLPELSMNFAMGALSAGISYLNLMNDSNNFGHYNMKLMNLNRFVHLDAASVSALNLFPKTTATTITSQQANKCASVQGVLDHCKTPQGHRLLAQWLKQPLRNAETIADRHEVVESLVLNTGLRQDIRECGLKYIPDIMMINTKMIRKKASLEDIYKLYQMIGKIPVILQYLLQLENSTVKSSLHDPLKDVLGDLVMLKQMIEQVLDMERVDQGKYYIKSDFDPTLNELREKLDVFEEKMNRELSKAIDDLEKEENGIKLDFVSHIGYHFRMTLSSEKALREKKKYKIIDTVKGNVRFTTTKLEELNADHAEIRESFDEAQSKIVEEVLRIAVGYLVPLSNLNHLIAQIDVLASFAVAATEGPVPFVRPRMHPEGSGVLRMKQLRHPCIELQDDIIFIGNDVNFEPNRTNMKIITGPNCGGKSTYIRSAGVAVLLAHIGSFVPCAEADISAVDAILGRVGADDNLTKGLSTFMVEMIETAGIIRSATNKSLVIIDELGRGTSTYEGCGLAYAIAEHLAQEMKCLSLFATHFHEITDLASFCPTVKNYHMLAEADAENFTLLYQIAPGVIEKSFGIQVAKLAEFPESVVNDATRLYENIDEQLSYKVTNAEITATLGKTGLSAEEIDFCKEHLCT